jgi:hypothetical protein
MRLTRFSFLSAVLTSTLFVSSCILSDDVDRFSFALPEKTYQMDTASMGMDTTTEISCDSADDLCPLVDPALVCDPGQNVCVLSDSAVFPTIDCSGEDVCVELGGPFFCDARYDACSVETPIQLSAAVHLSEEVEEIKEVGNLTFTEVTLESLFFTVEVNTLGVESPPMGLYVADNGVLELSFDETGEVITPGVHRVGTLPSVPANFTGRKDAVLTAAGREAISSYIKEPDVPFKLFVAGIVNVSPGQALPNQDGQFRVVISGTASAETDL